MLRPFRDELGIFVGPSKVLLAKMRRGLLAKCVAERSLTVGAGDPGDWTQALDAFDDELADSGWGKMNGRVVISDHWVHYEVLPWSVELSNESERLAHARYLLSSTYGDVVEHWAVTLSEAAPGAPRLVSAIPEELLDRIKTIAADRGVTLVSLQPQLVVAYNLWRHRLPPAAAWFASIDEGSLVAMHLRDGRCDRVRAVRISDNWDVELRRIQTMGRLAQSRPAEGPMFVDAPLHVRTRASSEHAGVEWLESEKPPSGTLARLAALRELHA